MAVLPAGAVLTLPAPPDEYGEDLVEAYWLHRSLSHGHPVTGGASGWVPPYTRRLRERLALCVEGRGDLVSLWNELHTLGVRYVEVQDANDAQREQTWRRLLLEHGFRPTPSAPGYTLYLLPGETARSTDGS